MTRERHSLAPASLQSLLRHTPESVPILYADLGSPGHIEKGVREVLASSGRLFSYERFEEKGVTPQEVRTCLMNRISTPYVVFVDNDVLVEPLWLDRLLACACETGALLTGPLYLWSDGHSEPSIHMAGGVIERMEGPAGRCLRDRHDMIDSPVSLLANTGRHDVDFLEYHCLLAVTEFVREPGVLSREIVTLHEHIDLALTARARGGRVVMEPACRILYLGKNRDYTLDDLEFFRHRWSQHLAEKSLAAFARKWDIDDLDGSFAGVRGFRSAHLARHDIFMQDRPEERVPATAGSFRLVSSRYELLKDLSVMGYPSAEAQRIAMAVNFAMLLFDGLYRCDGRPFLSHAVGAASVLARCGVKSDIVIAGLLAWARRLRPDHVTADMLEQALAQWGPEVGRLLTELQKPASACLARMGDGPGDVIVREAARALIEAAGEIDKILSGEYEASQRERDISEQRRTELLAILSRLGLGFAREILLQDSRPPSAYHTLGALGLKTNFRFSPDRKRLVAATIRPLPDQQVHEK
jgi:hypothetical protein